MWYESLGTYWTTEQLCGALRFSVVSQFFFCGAAAQMGPIPPYFFRFLDLSLSLYLSLSLSHTHTYTYAHTYECF